MKSKILCLILIFAIVCSIFVISCSAEVYNGDAYVRSSPLSTSAPFDFISNGETITLNSNYLYSTPLGYVTFSSFRIYREDVEASNSITFNVSAYISEYSTFTNVFDVAYTDDGEFISYSTENANVSLSGYIDIPSYDVALWLYQFVEFPFTPPGLISPGYYRLALPIDITDPSWIGDGNSVWYNMRGRVITDNSNRAFSFYRIGLSYNSWETSVDRESGWSLDVLITDYQHEALKILSITYFDDNGQFYWNYNDLVLDSFAGLALDGEYEVKGDFLNLFESLFEPYDYVYTGNPWYDIVDGVVDALKIDVFGDFSPWDILITFIGISIFIWLLKLLAGG